MFACPIYLTRGYRRVSVAEGWERVGSIQLLAGVSFESARRCPLGVWLGGRLWAWTARLVLR